jgi:hypothetical protein
MPVKSIIHPTTRQTLFFGRKRPKVRPLTLAFKNYTMKSLAAPPPNCSYFTTSVVDVLSQMYLNDQLGDCVIAELGHTAGVMTGNANGSAGAAIFTDAQITALYSAIGGYVPGDPSTDNGCVITDALAYWATKGLLPDGSHKIAGYLAIDGTDKQEVQTAVEIFENLDFGIELPDKWVSPMPSSSGFVWDVAGAADPDNGHSVLGFSYDELGVLPSTWGMVGHITWAAIAEYTEQQNGGELYTVISQDQLSKAQARTPRGIDWTQMVADFESLGGSVSKAA